VIKKAAALDQAILIGLLKPHVACYQTPAVVELRDELPFIHSS